MTEMMVYTLSWDTDAGCGCEVFLSSETRDASFREALLTYATPALRERVGMVDDLRNAELPKIVETLDQFDCLDGVRFSCGSQVLKLSN